MDTEQAFADVMRNLSEGRTELVAPAVTEIAQQDKDPMVRIKCLSLLKVVDGSEASKEILRMLMDELPDDREQRMQVAGALRSLGFPSSGLSVLDRADPDDSAVRLRILCLMDLEEYESALDASSKIADVLPFDRVNLCEINSALGQHAEAISIAEALLSEYPKNYQVRKAYVSSLILGGREKDATKYIRAGLKDKSADSNAIAAYVLRVMANYKSAAGFATRALNIDNGHLDAMETLGICLAYKGEYEKARIVAGAINEKSPGDRAALNVLRYCEGH